MIKNTSSSEIRISKQNVENDEKHYHIIIHDYNIEELGTEPTRDFANGKIRDAMKFFLGLGDYFIIANFKGHGWKKINMYDAEDITSLEKPACGFSHYLRLPIV